MNKAKNAMEFKTYTFKSNVYFVLVIRKYREKQTSRVHEIITCVFKIAKLENIVISSSFNRIENSHRLIKNVGRKYIHNSYCCLHLLT